MYGHLIREVPGALAGYDGKTRKVYPDRRVELTILGSGTQLSDIRLRPVVQRPPGEILLVQKLDLNGKTP